MLSFRFGVVDLQKSRVLEPPSLAVEVILPRDCDTVQRLGGQDTNRQYVGRCVRHEGHHDDYEAAAHRLTERRGPEVRGQLATWIRRCQSRGPVCVELDESRRGADHYSALMFGPNADDCGESAGNSTSVQSRRRSSSTVLESKRSLSHTVVT